MVILPSGTSWPTWHWWTHLSAAEQAAWAAACMGCVVGLLAAAGGFAAAWASFRAARVAVAIAKLPLEQQEGYRLAKAKVVATAIGAELSSAQHQARVLANLLRADQLDEKDVVKTADIFRVAKTAALERFFDRFDVFGLEEGIVVANAGSAALNFNSQIDAFKRSLESPLQALFNGADHVQKEIDSFCVACDAAVDVIQRGLDVLIQHGARV